MIEENVDSKELMADLISPEEELELGEAEESKSLEVEDVVNLTKRKSKKSPYNTTDLDPYAALDRHIIHRDQIGHQGRWSYMLKQVKPEDVVVDFGCGSANLLETLYRNKFKCKNYVGLDIRKKTIQAVREKFKGVSWAKFDPVDLIVDNYDYESLQGDKVVTFEVMEHVGKQNVDIFLQHFLACGKPDATYFLSTPNYDPKVGAAANHTYDSGDGRGIAVQEFSYLEIKEHLEKYFIIEHQRGTFASVRDYKEALKNDEEWKQKAYEFIDREFDSNYKSIFMAPMYPALSRNTMWILKRK